MKCLTIKKLRDMKKTYLLVIMAAIFAICSCTKVEYIDVTGRVLAEKEVPVTAGSFQLPITVNGTNKLVWKVRPVHNWLHVDDNDWKQNAYNITVRYDSNESSMNSRNFARVGHLVVETYDGFVADTIVVKQRGITPSMKLSDVAVEASETKCVIPFNTNLTDACRPGMTLSADVDWVENVVYLGNGTELEVTLAANGGEERTATITVLFVDAWGNEHYATCVLTQKAYVAETPETPETPVDPETPENPETPVDPETPEQPNEPSQEPQNVK